VGFNLVAALALLAAALAACGSSARLPPAAEPATSPPLATEPAGTVVPIGPTPEALAFDPATGLLAVRLAAPDRLAFVDGETGRRIRRGRTRVGRFPRGGTATTADGEHVGVVRTRERALEVFDARTLRPTGRVHVGIGPTHLVGGGGRFFVVDTRGDALLEVRLHPLRVHRRTHLGGTPYGIALDRARRRYWVTLTARNEVAELTDHRVLRRFPTVRQPDSVAVDPGSGRVFVASRTDGKLQFFDPAPCKGHECDR
jgi:DNA-binding beta-propeller fold protein YncE